MIFRPKKTDPNSAPETSKRGMTLRVLFILLALVLIAGFTLFAMMGKADVTTRAVVAPGAEN